MFSLSFRTEKLTAPALKSKPGKAQWLEWEAALLVETALSNQVIDAFIPRSGIKIQTFIHAFDLQASEILLDGFYPKLLSSEDLIAAHSPLEVWLQIKTGDMLYLLLVELVHFAAQFVTVRVLDAGMTRNRRWEDRIYFPRLSAPQVELRIADTFLANAQLSNLSLGGAQIIVFGPHEKQVLRQHQTLRCNIRFNQELNISMQAGLLQRQFFKSPCLHSLLRIKFQYSDDQQRAHLRSLLFAYQSENIQRVA